MFKEKRSMAWKLFRAVLIAAAITAHNYFVLICAPSSEFIIAKVFSGTIMIVFASHLLIRNFIGDRDEH